MTHRERILAALNHNRPDRLPMDLGTTRFTGMVLPAYDRLRAWLGFGKPAAIVDRMQQVVEMDEAILAHFDVDCRSISQGAPDRGGDEELAANAYRDEWGVVRAKPEGCPYYELRASPLAGRIDAQTIARYPFPDPSDPGRRRNLREHARRLRAETDFAIIYNARYNIVHQTQYLRGFEDWYYDLGGDPGLFTALMQAVTENLLEANSRILSEVGEFVDVLAFGDDVGLQDRSVCSPALYRKLIRPWHERCIAQVRSLTNAKVLYHTCGSVYRLIPDFIDIGIDALNPIQPTAKNMEAAKLQAEFGGRIAFWGGIDTQHILPHATPEDVRAEVRRVDATLGASGGFVLAAVHNIQGDVPPENVAAMFRSFQEAGA